MKKITQNNPDTNLNENIAQEQETKKRLREDLNRGDYGLKVFTRELTDEEVAKNKERAEEIEERIVSISQKFEGFIKKHGGLTGAKNTLIESRKSLLKDMEKDNPVWMTTFSVTEVIPNIKLEGLEQKERPDSKKGNFRLNSRKYEYDRAPENVANTTSNHLDTPFAGFSYRPAALTKRDEKEKKIKKRSDWDDKTKNYYIEKLKQEALMMEKIIEKFKGQVVIDIAAGGNKFGYLISDFGEAKAYVAIEPFRTQDLFYTMRDLFEKGQNNERVEHKLNGTPLAIVQEDMLNFLRRLPNNSVSIWCSGIDHFVIPDEKYKEAVAKEIERVLDPNGAYIGGDGHILVSDTELEHEDMDNIGIIVYEKKSS